jgi:hypothetical protein
MLKQSNYKRLKLDQSLNKTKYGTLETKLYTPGAKGIICMYSCIYICIYMHVHKNIGDVYIYIHKYICTCVWIHIYVT